MQFHALVLKNEFSQIMLDQMIDLFNNPINKYTPILNAQGDSKLAEYIRSKGWGLTFAKLKEKNDSQRVVDWNAFEGAKRGDWVDLIEGVYYGQMLNGKRDGYGILYCTNTTNYPFLYECEW